MGGFGSGITDWYRAPRGRFMPLGCGQFFGFCIAISLIGPCQCSLRGYLSIILALSKRGPVSVLVWLFRVDLKEGWLRRSPLPFLSIIYNFLLLDCYFCLLSLVLSWGAFCEEINPRTVPSKTQKTQKKEEGKRADRKGKKGRELFLTHPREPLGDPSARSGCF